MIRRIDHVAVLVSDTARAVEYFAVHLGLEVVLTDVIAAPPARLTYLDVGNAYLQLVEPLDPSSPLAGYLSTHGEGFHHLCFGVDDVTADALSMSVDGPHQVVIGSGRGRRSAFVPGPSAHGFRLECTEFEFETDAVTTRGFLGPVDRSM